MVWADPKVIIDSISRSGHEHVPGAKMEWCQLKHAAQCSCTILQVVDAI